MIPRPPRSTPLYSSAASDVYKRQSACCACRWWGDHGSGRCPRGAPWRPGGCELRDLCCQTSPECHYGAFHGWFVPVSYTHLRAHETKANLVCRLLLEKKKK